MIRWILVGNMLTGKSVPVSRILKSAASSMMDAGLIEYVSITTPIKVSRMIWAYDGCRLAYWQASLRMFARKFLFDHSQSMLEVRLRRNRVFFLSYRQEAALCVPMYKW